MKNIFAIIALLSLSAFAQFPTYQPTPPNAYGGASAALTDQSTFGPCLYPCNVANDLVSSSLLNLRQYVNSGNKDTSFTFIDSVMSFTVTKYDTLRLNRRGLQACISVYHGFTGTSDSTTFAMISPIPSVMCPPQRRTIALGGVMEDSGVDNRNGDAQINPATCIMSFRRANLTSTYTGAGLLSATFLGSGTKGIDSGAGGCYTLQP